MKLGRRTDVLHSAKAGEWNWFVYNRTWRLFYPTASRVLTSVVSYVIGRSRTTNARPAVLVYTGLKRDENRQSAQFIQAASSADGAY